QCGLGFWRAAASLTTRNTHHERRFDMTPEESEEFRKLGELQTSRSRFWQRRQWVAIFSVNARGNEWSFRTYGRTPFRQRNDLRKIRIAESLREEIYLAHRPVIHSPQTQNSNFTY